MTRGLNSKYTRDPRVSAGVTNFSCLVMCAVDERSDKLRFGGCGSGLYCFVSVKTEELFPKFQPMHTITRDIVNSRSLCLFYLSLLHKSSVRRDQSFPLSV